MCESNTGVREGDEIGVHYDPMIAKLISGIWTAPLHCAVWAQLWPTTKWRG
jgi:acetyl/propionyl-CoA carboxylase alpha subunit